MSGLQIICWSRLQISHGGRKEEKKLKFTWGRAYKSSVGRAYKYVMVEEKRRRN